MKNKDRKILAIPFGHKFQFKTNRVINQKSFKDMVFFKQNRFFSDNYQFINRIMRLMVIFLVIGLGVCQASTIYSQTTTLSLKMNNRSVKDVLTAIENQSEYVFFYYDGALDVNRKVNINAKDKLINQILDLMFSSTENTYVIKDRQVFIYKKDANSRKEKEKELLVLPQQNPAHSISGKVTDEKGEPVIGANVKVKGASIGTVTDVSGAFTLRVIPGTVIQVSYIGYVTKEISIGVRTNFSIQLSEDKQALDEVVVVGYGTVKKSDLTGALVSVSAKDFALQPILNSTDVMMGRLSGVMVSNTSGNVDASVKIRIRGSNSINGGNDPLYVVDGVVGASMPPSDDIASIEVLKDASSTAIYGSRGANGVVLVTTKSGKEGDTVIKVNAFLSNIQPTHLYDVLDPYAYAQEINIIHNNVYSSADLQEFQNGTRGTDWQKEILNSAWQQKYNVSLDGGSNKIKYHVFGEYSKNASLIKRQNNENYILRSNFNMDLYKNLSLQMHLNGNYNNSYNTGSSTYEGGADAILFNALTWGPTESIYESDGSYNLADNYGAMGNNPVQCMLEKNTWKKNSGFSTYAALTWQALPSLSLQYSVDFSLSNGNNYEWDSSTYTVGNASASGSRGTSKTLFQDFIATWNKSFGLHNITVTGVAEGTKYTYDSLSANGDIFSNETLGYWGMASASSKGVGTGWSDWSLLSYIGRANYNYAGKYYATAAFRSDGSSKFAKGNRWGYFPSGSLAWRASEESFIKDLDIFSNLKFRASYGKTGNQGVNSYSTIASLAKYDPKIYGMNDRTVGYSAKAVNAGLKWEQTAQTDFGIDMGFFKNRLNVTLDYYQKNTSDLLLTISTPYYLGGDQIYRNIGKVRNRGLEASINVVPIQTKDICWEIQANISRNKNRIMNLGGQVIYGLSSSGNNDSILSDETYIVKEGLPLGELYGYKCLGIWQTSEATEAAKYGNKPGDYKYEDLDGNGKIDASDRTSIGNGTPDYFWGLNSTFRYKHWDLNILLQGVQGADKLNVIYAMASSFYAKSRTITLADPWYNRWTESNPSNKWPKAESTTSTNYINSTQWIQDASFIRLKNLSLGYTFDKSLTKIGDFRLYVSSQNLFTITKYKGYDPESSSTLSSDVATGIDSGITPSALTVTFGAQLTF